MKQPWTLVPWTKHADAWTFGPLETNLDISPSWSRFASPVGQLLRASLACMGAGEQVGPAEPFRGRALSTHGLVIVSRGRGSYSAPGRSSEAVVAPALMWLFPGVEHGYGPEPSGWTEHWLLFSGPAAGLYEELGLVDRDHPVVSLEHIPIRPAYLFGLLRQELSLVGVRAQLRSSLLAQELLESAIAATPGNVATRERATVIQILESTAFESGSVAERARKLGMSVSELRSSVRESTGMTPLGFILEVRLARARVLLADSMLDVRQVAETVGFDDPAYFSRLFTARTTISPSAFRQQQRRQST